MVFFFQMFSGAQGSSPMIFKKIPPPGFASPASLGFRTEFGWQNGIYLVVGFNPLEKYSSKWVHLPQVGVKIKRSLKFHHLVIYVAGGSGWLRDTSISHDLFR